MILLALRPERVSAFNFGQIFVKRGVVLSHFRDTSRLPSEMFSIQQYLIIVSFFISNPRTLLMYTLLEAPLLLCGFGSPIFIPLFATTAMREAAGGGRQPAAAKPRL